MQKYLFANQYALNGDRLKIRKLCSLLLIDKDYFIPQPESISGWPLDNQIQFLEFLLNHQPTDQVTVEKLIGHIKQFSDEDTNTLPMLLNSLNNRPKGGSIEEINSSFEYYQQFVSKPKIREDLRIRSRDAFFTTIMSSSDLLFFHLSQKYFDDCKLDWIDYLFGQIASANRNSPTDGSTTSGLSKKCTDLLSAINVLLSNTTNLNLTLDDNTKLLNYLNLERDLDEKEAFINAITSMNKYHNLKRPLLNKFLDYILKSESTKDDFNHIVMFLENTQSMDIELEILENLFVYWMNGPNYNVTELCMFSNLLQNSTLKDPKELLDYFVPNLSSEKQKQRILFMQLVFIKVIPENSLFSVHCYNQYKQLIHQETTITNSNNLNPSERNVTLVSRLQNLIRYSHEIKAICKGTPLTTSIRNEPVVAKRYTTYFKEKNALYKDLHWKNWSRKRQSNTLFANLDKLDTNKNEQAYCIDALREILKTQDSILSEDANSKWVNRKGYSRLYDITKEMFIQLASRVLTSPDLTTSQSECIHELLEEQFQMNVKALNTKLKSYPKLPDDIKNIDLTTKHPLEREQCIETLVNYKNQLPSHIRYLVTNLESYADLSGSKDVGPSIEQ